LAFEPQPFGKYYLLERVALGGMAEIYKAKTFGAVGFEKLLAIKRILPHMSQNTEFINMLVDEAKIAVQLNHTNIVQVFDLGKVDDDYFIAMEFIEGMDLRTIMKRLEETGRRMAVEDAAFIIVEVCKGLDYAHRKKDQYGVPLGLVHRDISPQNILISYEGEVKIVDFGIAKAARKATETDAGVLKGKFAYMAPEQARGEEVDSRSDIFPTAIMLYEMLTGKRMFVTESNLQTLEKIKSFHIEPPFLPPEVPSELEFILMQAMANDPNERYQSAEEFQIDLTKFLYTSALDFTAKNLAELMQELFPGRGKVKTPIPENAGVELDTETRLMISEANQEVLVSREEEDKTSHDFVVAQPPPVKPEVSHITASQKVREPTFAPTKASVPKPHEVFAIPPPSRNLKGLVKPVAIILSVILILAGAFFLKDKFGAMSDWAVGIFDLVRGGPNTGLPRNTSQIYIETSPPGARIYFDSVELDGLTPFLIKDVKPNVEHVLMFSMLSHEQYQMTLKTKSREILKLPVIKLKRERGNLFVASEPSDADIYINDEFYGKTPRQIEQISANVDVALKLRKAGFQDFFEVIRAQAGQTRTFNFTLNKAIGAFGAVRVESVPPGALVFIDGVQRREKTPVLLTQLDIKKEHELVLRLQGYKDHAEKFRLSEGGMKAIKAYMKTTPEELK